MVDQGVVGSGLCYVGMAWCVEQRGPVFTSAFTPLIQIFVAIVGFFILHERIYPGRLNLSYFFHYFNFCPSANREYGDILC